MVHHIENLSCDKNFDLKNISGPKTMVKDTQNGVFLAFPEIVNQLRSRESILQSWVDVSVKGATI